MSSCVVIATSGIDYNIKLWEPKSEELCSLDNLEEVSLLDSPRHS